MVVTDRYPAPASANEPPGTLSTFREYVDASGVRLAGAFVYLRQDGSYGGSGAPDPKWLLHGGAVLIASHGDRQTCPACAHRRGNPQSE